MFDVLKITIDDREEELKPTPAALEILNKKYGGMQPVYAKLGVLDIDCYVDVLCVGIEGRLPLKEEERKLAIESVFKTGVLSLMSPFIKYINLLLSGGKFKEGEVEDTDPKN